MDVTASARISELEEVTKDLILAMWGLRTTAEGRASSALTQENIALVRRTADRLGVELPG